jgi:predicted alpha/beta-hydrolase family hydrolase
VTSEKLGIGLDGAEKTSGLWLAPANPQACLVLAHGAGANMAHQGMEAIAQGLAARGVATLRYNFLYSERGGGRPDAPPLAHKAVRAAAAEAAKRAPGLALFAGGRSFGGRMTSQAQALAPLAHVRGLVFFAFPLHPAGKPSIERADHLNQVKIPMLFLQGTNDALAERTLLEGVVKRLDQQVALHLAASADHSLHAPAKSGRKDEEVLKEVLDAAAAWMAAQRAPAP